ncbi:hypothetical protein EYR41_000009 [Orbilia oligospora]|uniref:Uncharacterized protein n=1 Tax=Orbilia oligospora TaxID=2813651 RepID=A0A7C8KC63_ORBOL|nr:hypothetical protein TWF751_006489 [Orbilia oligospora]TGJ72881.1 hypothetical protein EYR41_000009 [Orbilia oligospora]
MDTRDFSAKEGEDARVLIQHQEAMLCPHFTTLALAGSFMGFGSSLVPVEDSELWICTIVSVRTVLIIHTIMESLKPLNLSGGWPQALHSTWQYAC